MRFLKKHYKKLIAGVLGYGIYLTLSILYKTSPRRKVKKVYKKHLGSLCRAARLFNKEYTDTAYTAYIGLSGRLCVNTLSRGCIIKDRSGSFAQKALIFMRRKYLRFTKPALQDNVLDRIGVYFDKNGRAVVYLPVCAGMSGKGRYITYYLVHTQNSCKKNFMDEFPFTYKQLDEYTYICGKERVKR